jgi:hypothetical protein
MSEETTIPAPPSPFTTQTKVPVYNHSGQLDGIIFDGEMVTIAGGNTSGGSGVRMLRPAIAQAMVKEKPDVFSLAPVPATPEVLAALAAASKERLMALCNALLLGDRPADIPAFLAPPAHKEPAA